MMRMIGFSVLILLITIGIQCSDARRSQFGRSRAGNLIVERPEKSSNGLFEKAPLPQIDESQEESEEPSDESNVSQPSWFRRIWENAFGGPGRGRVEESDSHESEEAIDGFFTSLRAWWKGPNVCQRETHEFAPKIDSSSGDSFSSFFTFLMTTCHDSGRSYKCTKRSRHNSTATKVHTLTYECCPGFARDIGRSRSGCPKKIDLLDIASTLHKSNASKLIGALEVANLTSLVGEGKITLFAPSDNAIASSQGQNDINVVVLETADKMHFVRDILRSHVVRGPSVYSSDDFEDEMLLPTASNGVSIRINAFRRPELFYTANCAEIQSSDHQAANGTFIHVVDKVLLPVKRNLWQLIEADPKLSVMRSLIDETIKRRLIDSSQHLTLLAFTDESFEKIPQATRQRIMRKDNCFNNLLLHHLVPHTICTAAIYDQRGYLRNSASRLINATRSADGIVRIADRKVIAADQMATNGVMHLIDGVILVPEMLDTLSALEQSTSPGPDFARALQSRELAPSLVESEQPITVFVPPVESIANMTTSDLRNHIVRRSIFDRFRVYSTRPRTVLTDAGRNLSVKVDYDYAGLFDWEAENRLSLYVGCARAERIVSSCNGAIVYLDKPLSHPTQSAYDLMKSSPELSEFVSLIEQAGLIDLLKGAKLGGTVLAPTNDVLERSLNGAAKRRMLSNQNRLRRFLKEHIVLGTKCCNDLSGDEWLMPGRYTTMAGTVLEAHGSSAMSTLNLGGAEVQQCDLQATNGIVHVMDDLVNSRSRDFWPTSHWRRGEEELFDE